MDFETPPVFDPYEHRPFQGYMCSEGRQVETYLSLMHFIEAEKFRGLDEGYRRYILSIEDRDDFILETAGITQGVADRTGMRSKHQWSAQGSGCNWYSTKMQWCRS